MMPLAEIFAAGPGDALDFADPLPDDSAEDVDTRESENEPRTAVRRRGRPPGAKNKLKEEPAAPSRWVGSLPQRAGAVDAGLLKKPAAGLAPWMSDPTLLPKRPPGR